jgi:hypothetical protein
MKNLQACLRAIVNFFVEILMGCSHSRQTRPFTIESQTYKVCLDCGKQIYYSAQEMRPLSAWEIRRLKAAQAGEVRLVSVLPPAMPQLAPTREGKGNIAA